MGDLDGDGRYEIVLHQVGRGRDNSQRGMTTAPVLEAYTLDGDFLWRIDLGRNIREGAHYTQFMVYDLDGDGRAEVACKTADGTVDGQGNVLGDGSADYRKIIYGSCVIDDDGTGLYSTGLGHGDAMHVSDIDPDRPGLEVFKANGDGRNPAGIQLRDARTGEQLFGVASTGRDGVGRACALDIDPRYPGMEMWGRGRGVEGLFSAKGERIDDRSPRTCNMGVWWDGDLLRELLNGVTITKWDFEQFEEKPLFDGRAFGGESNNGSKSNPSLCADIYGDWREEIVARTRDGRELRIFTTTLPTEHRIPALMQDPVYRLGVAWQNVSYNQPAHPGYFLGHGMAPAPRAGKAARD